MFEEYKKIAGKDIEDSIKSEFSGDIKNSLVTVGELPNNLIGTKL